VDELLYLAFGLRDELVRVPPRDPSELGEDGDVVLDLQ
jgi:hypothetical protein